MYTEIQKAITLLQYAQGLENIKHKRDGTVDTEIAKLMNQSAATAAQHLTEHLKWNPA